jgi:ATP-dependent Clp protease ATP-binding subunit ClpC
VADEILRRIAFARQYLPNRHFPDKAVDLLEQCVAHAILHGKSRVEAMDAETVVRWMVGVPLDVAARMKTLRDRLDRRALLDPSPQVALAADRR